MKTTNLGVHMQFGGPGPLNSKNCSMSIPLTVVNSFKSFLLHKNWRGGGEFLFKNVQ